MTNKVVPTCLWVCEPHHWNVHVDNLELVGFCYLERRLKNVDQLADILIGDVHCALGVKLDPDLIEHVVILVCNPVVDVIIGGAVVLEDHGDEHVHNDHGPRNDLLLVSTSNKYPLTRSGDGQRNKRSRHQMSRSLRPRQFPDQRFYNPCHQK